MRPIAEWFIGAGFTAAPCNLFFFGNFHETWPHTGGAMGAIAKWLFLGSATATPGITPRFDVHYKGMIVFVHRLKVLTAVVDITLIGSPKLWI